MVFRCVFCSYLDDTVSDNEIRSFVFPTLWCNSDFILSVGGGGGE
jgi:hypothetical protein